MDDLHKLAKERRLDDLEAAWMDRLDRDRPGYDELLTVADYVARRVDAEFAGVLLWALATAAVESMGPGRALPLARRAAETLPKDGTLRQELAKVYVDAYPDIETMPDLVRLAGLLDDAPIGRACDKLDLWATMKPGTYVIARNSRRVARVEKFEVAEGKCVIRDLRGEWQLDLEGAVDELARLDQDDLRALASFEPDRLHRMAEDDPVALVELALGQGKGHRLEFRDLKQLLIPGAIDESGWSTWWKRAKSMLVRAPRVEMSGSTQPTFVLRDQAMTYEEDMAKRFRSTRGPSAAIKVALEFARERASSGVASEDLEALLCGGLMRVAQSGEPHALAAASVWDRLAEVCRRPDDLAHIDATVAGMSDLADRLVAIEDEHTARRATGLVRRALPEAWVAVLEEAIPRARLKRCELMARALVEAGPEPLRRVGEAVLTRRDKCPEAYAWLWKAVCDGRPDAPLGLDRFEVTLTFLALASRVLRAGQALAEDEVRRLRGVFRAVLAADNHATVCGVIADTDADTAQRIRAIVANNRGLHDENLDAIESALVDAHPDLFAERIEAWEDESVIWSTQEGLVKGRKELDRLMYEDIPANAKAIGEAAARGDLSENAEWTAALEERDLLARRAQTIQEDLARARVIPEDMAAGDRVCVGSGVCVRNVRTGEEHTFTFLGPWDVDLEHGVYYYRAPLSLAFMGKATGDRVVVGEGEHEREFEVLTVERVA